MSLAHVEPFYDKATSTFSYVVYANDNKQCAIIDSVLDYDPKASRTSTESAEAIVRYVRQHELQVQWILETHAHADHITAAPYLKEQLGGQIAIGAPIKQVQTLFKKLYNLGSDLKTDGSQFDRLFEDGESFQVGSLPVTVHHCPGHTCADMVYDFEGVGMFIGDTLFQPDFGTARCDFPGGDARSLYRSIQWILKKSDDTVLYLCHDYPDEGQAPRHRSSVGEQRTGNIHVHDGVGEEEFVKMRTERDQTLDMPALILQAVQINIRAGSFPPAEENGVHYLKIPLNQL